jgi:hypothetical protein
MQRDESTQIVGDEGTALAGAKTPSSRSGPSRREPVVLIHQHPSAAASDAGDAISPDESPQSVGEIAVRLVARWTLPRMQMKRPEGLGGEE